MGVVLARSRSHKVNIQKVVIKHFSFIKIFFSLLYSYFVNSSASFLCFIIIGLFTITFTPIYIFE